MRLREKSICREFPITRGSTRSQHSNRPFECPPDYSPPPLWAEQKKDEDQSFDPCGTSFRSCSRGMHPGLSRSPHESGCVEKRTFRTQDDNGVQRDICGRHDDRNWKDDPRCCEKGGDPQNRLYPLRDQGLHLFHPALRSREGNVKGKIRRLGMATAPLCCGLFRFTNCFESQIKDIAR